MTCIWLFLQGVWIVLMYRWTRKVGREMEVLRDQNIRLSVDSVETGKQLSDVWRSLADLEGVISDRDSRARVSKTRRKK